MINMDDRCLSKFVIASICVMAAILMFILTDSVYTSNAFAQTDETNIGGTNRTVNIQRTISSGENVTGNDDLGNALIMPSIIINNVGGAAMDKFTNIFTADSGNHTILKFDNPGKLITRWGSIGSGEGQFNGTVDISTDPTGNVYVVDANNKNIQKFDDAGKYIGKFAF